MIDVKYIATVRWNKELGEKLQALRGKMSRQVVSDETKKLATESPVIYVAVSWQYIQQLESPDYELGRRKGKGHSSNMEVSIEKLRTICFVINCDIGDLFSPTVKLQY